MSPRRRPLTATGTLLAALVLTPAWACGQDRPRRQVQPEVIGRWDITVQSPRGDYPSWLEVTRSGTRTLVGRFVGQFGSARPISRVEFDGGRLRFTVPPQWERRTDDQTFEGRLDGGQLRGETTDDEGRRLTWTARRAPSLKRPRPPHWGEPVELF